MCNKAVDNSAHALEFVPDQYKIQPMSIRAADDNPNAIEFVTD